MAREQANIRTDLWADSDWRELSEPAQRLYLLILSHPTLTYAGVADWRPNRLAALSATSTIESVRQAAAELQRRRFVYTDDDTEEILIRSFVKHDGLMARPNLVTAMSKAYGEISSKRIREIFAFEIQKLHKADTGQKMKWDNAKTILNEPARELEQDLGNDLADEVTNDPGSHLVLIDEPNHGDDLPLTTTTATSTATPSNEGGAGGSRKRRSTRLPGSWEPTEVHVAKAHELGLDLAFEEEQFRNHADANDRRQANWNAAFTMWLSKSKSFQKPQGSTTVTDKLLNPWKYQ